MAVVETQYGDYRFHNRLAARWAVFFDVLGVRFKYRQQTFSFTSLENRQWTPDFHLPQFQRDPVHDGMADSYLSVLERKPSAWELETGAHLTECERFLEHVYFFPRGVGESGLECYQLGNQPAVTACEFAQCPFCGTAYIGQFRAEDGTPYFNSHSCLEEYEFAERYDVDVAFLDFTGKEDTFPLPTESPILQIARSAAKAARFDSQDSLAVVRGMRASAETLREHRVFASPEVMHWLAQHASRLAADEHCPRFENQPYIVHAKHKRSGSRTPCPCQRCREKTPDVSTANLSEMKAPERQM
jgi:hypothetical protein